MLSDMNSYENNEDTKIKFEECFFGEQMDTSGKMFPIGSLKK
jgi:hypothetical protein